MPPNPPIMLSWRAPPPRIPLIVIYPPPPGRHRLRRRSPSCVGVCSPLKDCNSYCNSNNYKSGHCDQTNACCCYNQLENVCGQFVVSDCSVVQSACLLGLFLFGSITSWRTYAVRLLCQIVVFFSLQFFRLVCFHLNTS